MHLIEAGDRSLTICDRPSFFKSFFILIWSSFFIGIPGVLLFSTVAEVGTTRLVCQRLEPEQLSCEISKSKFLGLVASPKQKYSHVLQAQLDQEATIDSEGDEIEDNWVSLETQMGLIPLFEDHIRYSGIRGSEAEMLALTDEINALIQSRQPSFSVKRDLSTSVSQLLLPVLFCSIFIGIGFCVIGLTFQMRVARFSCERDRLEWKQYSMLGIQKKSIPFDEITHIRIETKLENDGLNHYQIFLESQERDRIQLGVTHWKKQAHRIQAKLQNLLQLDQQQPT